MARSADKDFDLMVAAVQFIGDQGLMDASYPGGMLDRLENLGLIRIETSAGDERSGQIFATEKGKRALAYGEVEP